MMMMMMMMIIIIINNNNNNNNNNNYSNNDNNNNICTKFLNLHNCIFEILVRLRTSKKMVRVIKSYFQNYERLTHNFEAIAGREYNLYRSSRSQMFFKIGVLRNFRRKTPVLESVFNKVAGLKVCNFIKKGLQNTGVFL